MKSRGHAKALEREASLERETSLESTQESTLTSSPRGHTYNDTSSDQITQPAHQEDLWSELFQPSDADNDRFPPLMEEEFFYPDHRYSELSCSDMSPLDWIADDDSEFADPSFFWNQSSSTSYRNEEASSEVGGFVYDPFCFDYGMDLFN